MGRRANPFKEHNIRVEKTTKLWNRLVRFHNFLVRKKVNPLLIDIFWKNFKPLLPIVDRKALSKINPSQTILRKKGFEVLRWATY